MSTLRGLVSMMAPALRDEVGKRLEALGLDLDLSAQDEEYWREFLLEMSERHLALVDTRERMQAGIVRLDEAWARIVEQVAKLQEASDKLASALLPRAKFPN